MSNKPFQSVRALSPGKSLFDLSYEKKFDCDMGQLIPVMADEVIPGDVFKISNEIVIRFQPLVAPILHEINAYVHYFFVPARIMDSDFEEFITGGEDGASTVTLDRWASSSYAKYSLWDYLGYPISTVIPASQCPLAFGKTAYNMIYNDYYRDENLINEVALTQYTILKRAWEKDYYTSALPWQQRGTAPALPISGTSSAVWDSSTILGSNPTDPYDLRVEGTTASEPYLRFAGTTARDNAIAGFNDNTVDLSSATTFDVSDLRLAFQIQKWLERNARGGARYTEFLKSHFGVSPRDDRLQRPEYIGGSKSPVIISEVLQTSSTDATTPQGNLAGHGLTADRTNVCTYRATEFGYIMGILSVMPRLTYNSQGINRQWLRETKYDFYFPEFAHLSEQAITRQELYCTTVEADNSTIFGYQGRYDELRTKQSMVCGDMRDTLDYWHLSKQFSSAPLLNQSFIECDPRKDIFATTSVPGLIVNFANKITAIRPIPISGEPGMIDHS